MAVEVSGPAGGNAMLNARLVRWGILPLALSSMLLAAGKQGGGKGTAVPPPFPERNPLPRPRSAEEAAYYTKLEDYRQARASFAKEAEGYWSGIADKRRERRQRRAEGKPIGLDDYVLAQPPAYQGPAEPVTPASLIKSPPPVHTPVPAAPPPQIPVIADFLEQARTHFGFVPEPPPSEADFKRAYAAAAAKTGISKDQAVRIYGFEASGNGRYDVQAGLEAPGAKRRAISTALGYNQLLVTNTISLLAQHGERIVGLLQDAAPAATPERRARIEAKIVILKQMILFAQSVPRKWSDQDDLARTPKGWAVHALILDIDTGPLLQARKLADSLEFAQKKGWMARLTAAELEMMNLMGDGSGYDVLSMPEAMRTKVPTANMFQRGGYERNSVVRKFNTVSALLSATDAKMDAQTDLPGAKEMEAAFDALAPQSPNAPVR